MRVPLQSTHFDHFLRSRSRSTASRAARTTIRSLCAYCVSSFVSLCPATVSLIVLGAIDQCSSSASTTSASVKSSRVVLDAIEALYFSQRGGKLGRTVLMVDEISKVAFVPDGSNSSLLAFVKGLDHSGQRISEQMAYRIVATFVDTAMLSGAFGRRGAVITAQRLHRSGIPDVSNVGPQFGVAPAWHV
jgi:hypothetical protein